LLLEDREFIMEDYFVDTNLVNTQPMKRAAYSDRTAWIMAEISRLVYERLPVEIKVTNVIDEIKNAIEQGKYEDVLEGLVSRLQKDGVKIESKVIDVLSKANFELVDSYSVDGTEAVVAKLESHPGFPGMLVLAFRGTQKSLDDIRTDANAGLVDAPQGGRVHCGFLKAFQEIENQIKQTLSEHPDLPIYITGHSLGGALAMLATRYLSPNNLGATYTFGCPRVANNEFFRDVRTPVYRVVNAADGVARLPFGDGFTLALSAIRLIPINGTKVISEWLRKRFGEYTHFGNLVFLSAPDNVIDDNGIEFRDLAVIKSPNIFWRARVVANRMIASRGKAAFNDHGIENYTRKLLAYAKRRNVEIMSATIVGDVALKQDEFVSEILTKKSTKKTKAVSKKTKKAELVKD